jgi:hypothetical protein
MKESDSRYRVVNLGRRKEKEFDRELVMKCEE